MPRVTYIPTKKKEPEPPVVDPVKGMFLERQNALGLSTKQMATLCGKSFVETFVNEEIFLFPA